PIYLLGLLGKVHPLLEGIGSCNDPTRYRTQFPVQDRGERQHVIGRVAGVGVGVIEPPEAALTQLLSALEGLEGFFLIPGMIKVSKPKFGVAHHRGDDRVSLYDLDECAGFFSTRGVKRRVLNKRGTSQTPGREVAAFTDQASLYGFIELVRVPAVHINQLIVNGVQPWLDVGI